MATFKGNFFSKFIIINKNKVAANAKSGYLS